MDTSLCKTQCTVSNSTACPLIKHHELLDCVIPSYRHRTSKTNQSSQSNHGAHKRKDLINQAGGDFESSKEVKI